MTTRLFVAVSVLYLAILPGLSAQDTIPAVPAPAEQPQRTGRIVGRVLEEGTGAPIAGAQVGIAAGGTSVSAGFDGRYTLSNVPAGPVALAVRAIGYAPKTVSGIEVPPGGVVSQDITLTAQTITVGEITVAAVVERGSVVQALDDQRNSASIVNSVTAEQMAKSPDGDAAQAVQRVSGVTVQDGRYVIVRGLGERYTTTSMNGARLPSPEPERRVVPLDLFPSGLLEAVTTTKTFTPDLPGDFSGAHVDLRTREFPARRIWSMSASSGANTAVAGRPTLRAPSTGSEWLGFAGRERSMPGALTSAPPNLAGLTQSEINGLIGSFRNAWTSGLEDGGLNGSFGVSVGGEDPVLGRLIGYLASLTYSYTQEARLDESRAIAQPGSTVGTFDRQNFYRGETGRTSVLWGGIFNLSTRIGTTTRLDLNNTYTRTADNEASRLAGFNDEFNDNFDITRLTFVERAALSNQLRGEHLFGLRHHFEWQLGRGLVTRSEPDRSDLVYQTVVDTATGASQPYAWLGGARSGARAFSAIRETSSQASLNYGLRLGSLARPTVVKVGIFARRGDRDADSRVYDITTSSLTTQERSQTAETIFSGAYASAGRLSLFANANSGRYTARDRNAGGFAMLELPVNGTIRLIGGARVERSEISVRTRTVSGTDTTSILNDTDVLPSLSATIALTANTNLRLSASQTVSRPEYRELSPVTYFDIIGGSRQFGNVNLRRALIQNYDMRWEWYPRAGEVISIGLFAKRFDNPIERILVQTAGGNTPDVSFANAEAALNYGVELEVRRSLDMLVPALLPFGLFANATIMHSDITAPTGGLSSLTNGNRAMVGQSPYVVNLGLTYTHPRSDLSATLLFNRAGRRILDAGILPLPDTYEEARSLVDVSVQVPLFSGVTAKLDGKNLFDAPFLVTQGSVERLRYRAGRIFSMGVRWSP